MGGAPLLRVLCTGQGAGGSLALLCGPWAALQFPTADADVITFGADWVSLLGPCRWSWRSAASAQSCPPSPAHWDTQDGFNTQPTWAFAQLVTLHYTWPFDSSDPALAGAQQASDGGGGGLAQALSSLINTDMLRSAVAISNLPPSLPPDYSPSYTGLPSAP